MDYKKILLTIALLILPGISNATFTVPFTATSTTQGWIMPNLINGVFQTILGNTFIATSTTATSTFPIASTTRLNLNGDLVTDFTGAGLKMVNGALTSSTTVSDIFINIKDYGAVGDGVTDDTDAINRAISVQQNASTTAALYCPAGNYNITGSLTPANRFIMKGISGAVNYQMSNRDKVVCRIIQQTDNIPIITLTNQGDSISDVVFAYENRQGLTDTNAKAIILGEGVMSWRMTNLSFERVGFAFYSEVDHAFQGDFDNIHVVGYSQSCVWHQSSATSITANQFYCQNSGENPVNDAIYSVTAVSQVGNVLTFTTTAAPDKIKVGMVAHTSSFNTEINTQWLVSATTSTSVSVITPSASPVTITDQVGFIFIPGDEAVGPAFNITGAWSIQGLDIEHSRLQSNSIFSSNFSMINIQDLHLESMYSSNPTFRYLSASNGATINVGSLQIVNMGCVLGQTCSIGYPNRSDSVINIGTVNIRDYNQMAATSGTGLRFTKGTTASDITIGRWNEMESVRGGSNPTPKSFAGVSRPSGDRFSTTTIDGAYPYFNGSLSIGSTTAAGSNSALFVNGTTTGLLFTATSTTGTSTLPNVTITNLNVGSDIVTDFTGTGISLVNGALTVTGGTAASSTLLLDNNTFSGITTTTNLNWTNATGTNATTTNLFSTTASTSNLFVGTGLAIGSTTNTNAPLTVALTAGTPAAYFTRTGTAAYWKVNFGSTLTNFETNSGLLNISNSATDAVNKSMVLMTDLYTTANGRMCNLTSSGTLAGNSIGLGGGSSNCKGATTLNFYTSENTNSTTGTTRLTINNLGNVTVSDGSASPTAKFEVVGTATTSNPTLVVASSSLTRMFVVDYNGNVGIATTTPGTTLGVQGKIVASDDVTTSRVIATSTTRDSVFPRYTGTTGTTTNATSTNFFATTASTTQLFSSNIGIGTSTTPASLTIDRTDGSNMILLSRGVVSLATRISSGYPTMLPSTGAMKIGDGEDENVNKIGGFYVHHYKNVTEEPACAFIMNNSELNNILNLGGGTSACNAATLLRFYTGATASTTTGTLAGTIGSTGLWTLGAGAEGTEKLNVKGNSVTHGTSSASVFNATSTTATSTFSGGITSPCFSTDGTTCITGGGSGTSNSKWSTSTDTTSIYANPATKVGIGTALPNSKLQITGDVVAPPSSSVYGQLEVTGTDQTKRLSMGFNTTSNYAFIQSLITGNNYYDLVLNPNGASAGNVGISTTTPYAKLSVTNTGTGPSFLVEDSTSPDTTPFIIDASGNVGIGTTSPYAKLSVVGQTVSEYFTATSTTATSTFAGGLSVASSLYVLQNGNVGIGTTTPTEKLVINGKIKVGNNTISGENITFDGSTAVNMRVTNSNGYVSIGALNSSGAHYYTDRSYHFFNKHIIPVGYGFSAYSTENLSLYTNTGSSLAMSILPSASGNKVGIGTTTPYAKLSVVGQTVSEYFTATSTTATSTFPLLSSTAFALGSDYITDLTGSNLSIVNGALTAADLTFSTTSADYWETTQTRWATTSDSYAFDTRLAATTTLNNITTLGGLSLPITQTTGTLSVSRGGTGQTSFGQGWLASDGTTITSSTTPTVNGIVATSTTFVNQMRGSLAVGASTTSSFERVLIEGGAATWGVLFANPAASNNNWRMGASGDGWGAGANKFLISAKSDTLSTNSLFTIDGTNGNVGISTTSPYARLSVAGEVVARNFTSTSTEVNTFPNLSSTNGTTTNATSTNIRTGYILAGDAYPLYTTSSVKSEVWGDVDGAVETGIGNRNAGTAAYNCMFQNNDRASSAVTDYYAQCLNSGRYSDVSFGTGMANPSQTSFENTMGQMAYFVSSTTLPATSNAYSWFTGGRDLTNQKMTMLNNGNVGIGTSTPNARMEIYNTNSTVSLAIDGNAGGIDIARIYRGQAGSGSGWGAAWSVANNNPQMKFLQAASSQSGGTIVSVIGYDSTGLGFFLATSSVNTGLKGVEPLFVKSSTANVGLAGTTTPWGSVSINGVNQSVGEPTFVVGSSTKTDFIIHQSGGIFAPRLTTAAGTPNSVCMNATTKEVTENAATTCVVSDEEQKSPLQPFTFSALDKISQTKPSSFYYNDNPERRRYGFGAQSLQKIDPQLADAFDKDGVARSIDLHALTALNTKAIQELDEKIEAINPVTSEAKGESDSHTLLWIAIGVLALGLGVSQYQIYKLKK